MALSPLDRHALLAALPILGERLRVLPGEVVAQAVGENPWFTDFYVRSAIHNLLPWLDAEALQRFLAPYPPRQFPARRVGIIMAGNLPLVGFHDLLVTLLCGHQAVVKPSHQDEVLIRWVTNALIEICPEMADYLEIVRRVDRLDYLLATGTDNSTRYFRAAYQGVPSTIRGNRLSVGLLQPGVSEAQLEKLASDILLFNGLGCRNISNLLIHEKADIEALFDALESYPLRHLNPLYLQKVLREQAIARIRGQWLPPCSRVMARWSDQIRPMPMGVVNFVRFSYVEEAEAALQAYGDGIQCAVKSAEGFGQTQCPDLTDYSDGVNTMEILMHLP